MINLNRNTTNISANLPIKIMQFGGGNFLRAFVDTLVQQLNEKGNFNAGIAIIKPTKRGDYASLKAQDGLFHVVLDGIKNGEVVTETKLISSVQTIINAYTEWHTYLELAKNPNVRFVVSNTTEAGIKFNAEDKITEKPPKEFPAKLTLWLLKRFNQFKGADDMGCILLPCELIEDNGVALKKCILQYATLWKLPDAFINWVETSNHFCNTLVDRIVSGYPIDRATEIEKKTGFKDVLLVAGELYHSWVIQGAALVAKELPFAKTELNVEFVDDLAPYREMKVRVLNGAHTSLVPVGYLYGVRMVDEAMDDTVLYTFVKQLLLEEVSVTLNFPNVVKNNFVNDVLARFKNPKLKHQLISISLNSTSKFVSRLLPTLKDYVAITGTLPNRIVFSMACLIRFYKGEVNKEIINLNDDASTLEFFNKIWRTFEEGEITLNGLTKTVLKNKDIWSEDLGEINNLEEKVSWYLQAIENNEFKDVLTSL